MRTARSSAIVTTSPARTGWLVALTRSPLSRTLPPSTSAAAAVRVRTTRACHSHLSMRWRSVRSHPFVMAGLDPAIQDFALLAFLELRLQRGKFRKRRIGIRLPAPLLRIDPLAWLAAIAILEVAPALAARTIVTPLVAVAIRTLATATLTLLRATFGALLAIAITPMARTLIMPFG